MSKLRIEKMLGGFAQDYEYNNLFGVESRSDKYTNSTGVNLFVPGFEGYLAPGDVFSENLSDSGVVNSLVVGSTSDIQTNSDPTFVKTYMISGGLAGTAPKIILAEGSAILAGTAITPTANFTTITSAGTGQWGEDIIMYKHKLNNVSTLSCLFSYNDSAGGDVGRFTPSATTATIGALTSNYLSGGGATAPAGAAALTVNVPHKMVEGADLVLYITNGQYLASYDGNDASDDDGKLNTQALNLGDGWVAVDVRKYKNFVAVGCVKAYSNPSTGALPSFETENKVVLWDGFSPDPNFVYEVNDFRLSALFVAQGVMYAFTDGKNNTTKIWGFDGTGFKMLAESLISIIGNSPPRNCIDYYRDCIVWANGVGAQVIAYGKLSSSSKGIHYWAKNTDGTNVSDKTGFLKNVTQGSLRASRISGSTYDVNSSSIGTKYLTSCKLRTRLITLPHRSMIKKFTIDFAQLGTGASVTLSLFKNKTTESVGGGADLLNKQLTATGLGVATETFSFDTFIDDVSSFYMTITFDHAAITNTAAIIKCIEMEIEPTGAY